jgi:hypothetical protein
LASSFPIEWYYRELVANGEAQRGDDDLARVIRDAGIPSTLTAPPTTNIAPPESPPDAEPSPALIVEPTVHTVPTSEKSLDGSSATETSLVGTPTESSDAEEDPLIALATNHDGIHDGLCFPVLLPVASDELPLAIPAPTRTEQDAATNESQTPENVSASESPIEDVDQPENQQLPPTESYGPKPAGDAFRLRDEEYLRALDEILATGDWLL